MKRQSSIMNFCKKLKCSEQVSLYACTPDKTLEAAENDAGEGTSSSSSRGQPEPVVQSAGSSSDVVVTSGQDQGNLQVVEVSSEPNHLSASQIPCQTLSKKTLYFQDRWYQQFPWLHFSTEKQRVVCFYCSTVCKDSSLPWIGNADPAFITEGFLNWKKAIERFHQHEASHTHYLSVNHFSSQTQPVDVQLITQRQEQQKTAARCLKIIATSVRYLAHEGLALRGHTGDSGHLQQLLKLRTADVPRVANSPGLTRILRVSAFDLRSSGLVLQSPG